MNFLSNHANMFLRKTVHKFTITLAAAALAFGAGAQSLEEAQMLAEDGDNAGAIAMLRTLEAA